MPACCNSDRFGHHEPDRYLIPCRWQSLNVKCYTSTFTTSLENVQPQLSDPLFNICVSYPLNVSPVLLVSAEPLGVVWSDVDVDGGHVEVFLVSGSARAEHLHVELNRVHAQNVVTHLAEGVFRVGQTNPPGQLVNLFKLRGKEGDRTQVNICAELDLLVHGDHVLVFQLALSRLIF